MGRACLLIFQPPEGPASLGSWPLPPSSKPDVSPELPPHPLPLVSTSILTSPFWTLIHMPPRQEGPVATTENPDSPPTSRPSTHSRQPSALVTPAWCTPCFRLSAQTLGTGRLSKRFLRPGFCCSEGSSFQPTRAPQLLPIRVQACSLDAQSSFLFRVP